MDCHILVISAKRNSGQKTYQIFILVVFIESNFQDHTFSLLQFDVLLKIKLFSGQSTVSKIMLIKCIQNQSNLVILYAHTVSFFRFVTDWSFTQVYCEKLKVNSSRHHAVYNKIASRVGILNCCQKLSSPSPNLSPNQSQS